MKLVAKVDINIKNNIVRRGDLFECDDKLGGILIEKKFASDPAKRTKKIKKVEEEEE